MVSSYKSSKPSNWGCNVITRKDRENLALNVSDFLVKRKPESKPFLLFTSLINTHDICFDAISFVDPESNEARATPPDLFEAKKSGKHVKKDFFDKYCPPLLDNHQPRMGESYSVDSLLRLRKFRKHLGIARRRKTGGYTGGHMRGLKKK